MSCSGAINTNPVNNLIFASASQEKHAHWEAGLCGYTNIFYIARLSLLKDEIIRIRPDVLLLDHDLPGLNGVSGISDLRKLCPETKIVLLKGSASDEEEWAMFKAGIRGCCSDDIETSSIKTLVEAVQKGELWIRRTLMQRLLEQLEEEPSHKNEIPPPSPSLLENLTHREYEIAVRVGSGDSNKQIAQSLVITERTVKAHLTEVFRKLGVTDRLKVAVIFWGKSSSLSNSSASQSQH